jgi:ketosteroid isomerase-like protein
VAQGNEEIRRRAFAAFNVRDRETLRECLDPEFEFAPHITGGFEGTTFRGFDGMLDFIGVMEETWENLEVEPSEVHPRNRPSATTTSPVSRWGRSSGIEVESPTVWFCRFRAGRILRIEARRGDDAAELSRALAEAGLPPDAFKS